MPLLILSRRKPHLILLMALAVLTGLSVLLGGPVDESMPKWVVYGWAGSLSISGLFVLIGNLARLDRQRGMHVERGALTMQSGAVLAYGFCIVMYAGQSAPYLISMIATWIWAGTNIWEVRLISKDLQMLALLQKTLPGDRNADD